MRAAPPIRSHVWLWVFGGAMLYVASCAPVEIWYTIHHAPNPLTLHSGTPAPPQAVTPVTPAVVPVTSPSPPDFQLGVVTATEVVELPAWMGHFYAPVHWLGNVPLVGDLLSRYRDWCSQVM